MKTPQYLSRRQFLILLGAGASASIFGYYTLPSPDEQAAAAAPQTPSSQEARPRLRDDLTFSQHAEMTYMAWQSDPGRPVCAVNQTGARVLRLLDGQHTVSQIAGDLAARLHITRTEAFDAKIAGFIAQLGMLTLLQEPFYVRIVEGWETA